MAFDGITVANLVQELSEKLTDARISKIIQPETDALFLTLKGFRGQQRLLLSASASLPLVYLTGKNRQAPLQAPNFCMLLRKHIGNGKIVKVYQPELERIIVFEIEHYDELGDLVRKKLIIELMGKHSNIIFCDEENRIIDSIKHISAQTSSVREVLPGRDWFIPETTKKLNPLQTDEESFEKTVFSKPVSLSKAIYTSYTGISPVIAEELCTLSSLESDQSAVTIGENERAHLVHQFFLMMEDVKEGRFFPCMICNAKGDPVEFSALRLHMYDDMQVTGFDSISTVLEQFYEMRDRVVRIRQKSSDLRRIVTTALERTGKKLDLQTRQMSDTKKRDQYRLYGELLHTYGYEAQEGSRSLKVVNYYNGEEVTIPLDPTMTASENAKRYYDRYAKLKRTDEALSRQIAETRADLTQLQEIQTFLDMALEEADLIQVKEELTQAGYIRRKNTGKKVKVVSKPYHYRTEDGYDLYVGKNNFQNDELTFQFAQGSDWWFHAKGAPGSHVILKSKGEEIPDHVFEDAARLAAYYSAYRMSEKAEIDYIQKKHVKKPNGAKPGFVVYYTNYSMVIAPDLSGLVLCS